MYCRSTTAPYFDDDFGEIGERAARDEETGKTYYVPADITYKDWHKSFAGGRSKDGLQELQRRKIGEQGQEIIDKPTYNKLTREFLRRGGTIIRGEEAKRHLEKAGAYASYLTGSEIAFIRDDATVSDVLEEMYHAEQNKKQMFGTISNNRSFYLREIDAQKYLLSVAEKYRIPLVEQDATRKALHYYENKLKEVDGVDLNDGV